MNSNPFLNYLHVLESHRVLTLRLIWDGHAQPLQVYTVLAADAGGPAAKGMEGNSADDEREFQIQLGRPWNVNANLLEVKWKEYVCEFGAGRRWRRAEESCTLKPTLSMYSTLMMRQCSIEGPTGGILMARPCHDSRDLAPTMSPDSVLTTARFCFMVPRAMNICVWMMYALGTMHREVELSNSANTGITSPVGRKRRLERAGHETCFEAQHQAVDSPGV